MKKKKVQILVALAATVALAGCGQKTTTTNQDSTTNEAPTEIITEAETTQAMDKDAAIKTLESYLDEHTSVTQKDKLIAVLKEQGFPYPIAVTAVDEVMKERDTTNETTTTEYDPINAALNACTNGTAGPSNGIKSLENDGYTHEEAESIVAGFDLDWNELAVQCATIKMNFYGIHWLDKGGLDDLISELKHMGYTQEQATYGAQTWWNNYQSQNS